MKPSLRFLRSFSHRLFIFGAFVIPLLSSTAKAQVWRSSGPSGAFGSTIHTAAWDSSLAFLGTARNGLFRRGLQDTAWSQVPVDFVFSPLDTAALTPTWVASMNLNSLPPFYGPCPAIEWIGSSPVMPNTLLFLADNTLYLYSDAGGMPYTLVLSPDVSDAVIHGTFCFATTLDNRLLWIDLLYCSVEATAAPIDNERIVVEASDAGDSLWCGGGSSLAFTATGDSPWTTTWFEEILVGLQRDPRHSERLWCLFDSPFVPGFTRLLLLDPPYTSPVAVSNYMDAGSLTFGHSGLPLFSDGQGQFWYRLRDDLTSLNTLAFSDVDTAWWMANRRGDARIAACGDGYLLAGIEGVFASNDSGATLHRFEEGLPHASVWSLAADPRNPDRCFAGGLGLFRTDDGGESWQRVMNGPVAEVAVSPLDSNLVLAVSDLGICRSTDGGDTWENTTGTGSPGFSSMIPQGRIAFHPTDPAIVWCCDNWGHLQRSLDGGATWERQLEDVFFTGVSPLVIDPLRPETIYAIRRNTLYTSTDAGDSWDFEQLPEVGCRDLLAGLPDPGELLLATRDHVFHRATATSQWQPWEDYRLTPAVIRGRGNRFSRAMDDPGAIYFSVLGRGIFRWFVSEGPRWEEIPVPSSERVVNCAVVGDNDMYLASALNGVWKGSELSLEVIEHPNPSSLPSDFDLLPPQPNPFNGQVRVTFRLARSMQAEVAVYDVQGRLVDNLEQGELVAGTHQLSWNSSAHASGVYFIRLETPSGSQFRKAVLLK